MNSNNDRPRQEAVAVASVLNRGSPRPDIPQSDTLTRRPLDRALPGRMVDLIRDGVPPQALRQRGGKAVFSALFRTAASASQRGWDAWEWQELVMHPASILGLQVQLRDGFKPRSPKDVQKLLDDAWDKATAWVNEQPPAFTKRQMAAEIELKTASLMGKAEDPGFPLADADRRVLAYACDQAKARGTDTVALPWRAVVEGTCLGERSAKNALQQLHDKGLLTRVEAGRSGTKNPRAALYRLAALPVPVNGSVGPVAQVCGTPEAATRGTPLPPLPRPVGPLEAVASGADRRSEVTLTLKAASPEALDRTLRLLAQEAAVDVKETTAPALARHDNVTPLRSSRRSS